MLSLGLNFAIAPKKLPIVDYIAATEKLCEQWEKTEIPEDIEKAKRLRYVILQHTKNFSSTKIRSNLSNTEREALRTLSEDFNRSSFVRQIKAKQSYLRTMKCIIRKFIRRLGNIMNRLKI